MEKNKNLRKSNIELLRIIAITLIVISHIIPFYGDNNAISYFDLKTASLDINNLILIFYRYLGQIGNVIFIVCSSYFFLDNKNVKKRKIYEIIIDTFFISILFLILSYLLNLKIEFKDKIKQLLPITFENNWFIGCYILFYIIHPYLNTIINNLEKRNLLILNTVFFIIYCILQSIFKDKFYYTKLVGFIILYFMTAYLKKFLNNFSKNKKVQVGLLKLSVIALLISIIINNLIGLKVGFLFNKMLYFCELYNPLIIIIAFSLFNIFINMDVFYNKIINYVASKTLIIYIIHDNYIFRKYINPIIFLYVYNKFSYHFIFAITPIIAIATEILSLFLATVYSNIMAKVKKIIIEKVEKYLNGIKEKYIKIFIKLD